jgi:hypothetical protein
MPRTRPLFALIALSVATTLAACGGGGADPAPTGSSVDPATPAGDLPCPVSQQSNAVCVPPVGTGGGTPPVTPPPPPPTPPTTPLPPPPTPPSANSDPCVIPVPGFSGTYRSSARPDLQIRTVVTGTTLAPVETTTLSAEGISTESRNELKVTLTASGGPQLTWDKTRTEITAPGFYSLQEYSTAQTLELPMLPGDSQTTGGAISGTHQLVTGPASCTGTVSGSQVVTYTYAGIDPVAVPAGNFAACRFSVTRVSNIKTTCNDGHGSGQGTDTTALWVLDGHIVKSVGADGSVLELMSYSQ